MEAIEALIGRISPAQLAEPGPSPEALQSMLDAGASAPDHGRLQPWRFIVISGGGLKQFGELMAQSLRRREPDAPDALLDNERKKAQRAPVIVVVAASVKDNPKIPNVEQIVAAGAAAQNILVAAHALGYGGFWRTGPFAYDPATKTALGLVESDTIIGFLYLGSVARPGRARELNAKAVTTHWPS